jgi:hypothetical protein
MVIAGLRLYIPPSTREFANLSDTSMPGCIRAGLWRILLYVRKCGCIT